MNSQYNEEEMLRLPIVDDWMLDMDKELSNNRPTAGVCCNVYSKMKLGEEDLGMDYVPTNYDITCGRGNSVDNQIGNRRFRVLISLHLQKYFAEKSRHKKTYIVISIVDTIRDAGGHFLSKDPKTSRWYDIGDKRARAKVGNALRDALARDQVRKSKERMPF